MEFQCFMEEQIVINEAINADWNQNDAAAPDHVKNRTHYEETVTVNEPLNLTWDGNTEGLVSVLDAFYKVSDLVLTDEQIKSGTIHTNNGNIISISNLWDDAITNGMVTTDFVFIDSRLLFTRKDNVTFQDIIIPEKGIYFALINDIYVSALITTEPVEATKTVIHKLNSKYLPKLATVAETGDYKDLIGAPNIKNGTGVNSLVIGEKTTAKNDDQLSVGRYNKNKSGALFEVGNGTGLDEWVPVEDYVGAGTYLFKGYDIDQGIGHNGHDREYLKYKSEMYIPDEKEFYFWSTQNWVHAGYPFDRNELSYLQENTSNAFAVFEGGSVEIGGTRLTSNMIKDIANIENVLDELHNYAQALINGGA